MTTYSPDYTSRYRCKYKACGIEHTITLRKALGATSGATALLAGTVHDIFNVWAALLPSDFAFISAEQADQGSNIFYPSTVPFAVTGALNPLTYTGIQKITSTNFIGRAFGSRARCSLYGIQWQFTDFADDPSSDPYNGKVDGGEDARITSTINLLNTQAFANSGAPTTWYDYADIKVNDYWLRQLRRGAVS